MAPLAAAWAPIAKHWSRRSLYETARMSCEQLRYQRSLLLFPCLSASWVGSYQMDDIKSLVTRFYDTWNAHDRDGWLACCYEDITFTGPGGNAVGFGCLTGCG